jgi:hypothetical protein
MYGKGESKDVDAHQTFLEFIAYDSAQFSKNYPSLKVVDESPLFTWDNKMVFVRKFLYDRHEVIAYIDEPKVVIMIVLTSHSKDDFDNSFSAFKQLVTSYKYISDNHLDKVTNWPVASKSADDNLKIEGGRQYESDMAKNAMPWISQVVSRCVSGASDSVLQAFTILVRIGSNGRAEEVLIDPNTKITQCAEEAFKAASYLKPPSPSWWVNFHIQ